MKPKSQVSELNIKTVLFALSNLDCCKQKKTVVRVCEK